MYEKEVSLEKLVNLCIGRISCFINGKRFEITNGGVIDIEQEDAILKELNEERDRFWRPVYGILDKVLDNGGKLYFNLTSDEGVFVIRKTPSKNVSKYSKLYKDVSQAGKLTHDGEEILLDKESDKDIYLDVQEFKPKFNSISEVYEELKDKKIDLDKTIDRAAPCSMSDILGDPLVKVICEGEKVYIRSVVVSESSILVSERNHTEGKIYEYKIDNDDFTNVILYSNLGTCTLRLSSQYDTGDEFGDYGIIVTDEGKIEFCENAYGICGGLKEIRDLSEPLMAFIVELLMDMLVFEDPSSNEVMYCPECDKKHYNGEEFCTDCGTELVTNLKFYMMIEYGDY